MHRGRKLARGSRPVVTRQPATSARGSGRNPRVDHLPRNSSGRADSPAVAALLNPDCVAADSGDSRPRWCSTTPTMVLSHTNRAAVHWCSSAPHVVLTEANIHLLRTRVTGGLDPAECPFGGVSARAGHKGNSFSPAPVSASWHSRRANSETNLSFPTSLGKNVDEGEGVKAICKLRQ